MTDKVPPEELIDRVLNGPSKWDKARVKAEIIADVLVRHNHIQSHDAKGLISGVLDGPRRDAPSRHMSKAITKALRKHGYLEDA